MEYFPSAPIVVVKIVWLRNASAHITQITQILMCQRELIIISGLLDRKSFMVLLWRRNNPVNSVRGFWTQPSLLFTAWINPSINQSINQSLFMLQSRWSVGAVQNPKAWRPGQGGRRRGSTGRHKSCNTFTTSCQCNSWAGQWGQRSARSSTKRHH